VAVRVCCLFVAVTLATIAHLPLLLLLLLPAGPPKPDIWVPASEMECFASRDDWRQLGLILSELLLPQCQHVLHQKQCMNLKLVLALRTVATCVPMPARAAAMSACGKHALQRSLLLAVGWQALQACTGDQAHL
jgi:hypothetical protein